LRYRVFAEEMAARLDSAETGLDRDMFDAYCEHLLVRDAGTGAVVGTYRILSAAQARRVGRFYSESEFDLSRLLGLPGLVEIGRACVHPDYRHGAVLGLLWAALANHFAERGYRYVIGCASIPHDEATGVCSRLLCEHLGPEEWRVAPRRPFELRMPAEPAEVAFPTLIRGYLRLGACVCGPPAWDEAFRTADVLMLLPMERMSARWANRFLRAA
jgi:putative hemolysin